jgi:hypothetical protein
MIHHFLGVRPRYSCTAMKKSELLSEIREEIQRHNLDTFMSAEHKIVETGCPTCQKHFGTIEQFKRHLTDDVLPPLLDRLSKDTV